MAEAGDNAQESGDEITFCPDDSLRSCDLSFHSCGGIFVYWGLGGSPFLGKCHACVVGGAGGALATGMFGGKGGGTFYR